MAKNMKVTKIGNNNLEDKTSILIYTRTNMRIGQIATGAEYRMGE